MSVFHSRQLNTDGLVMYLDASNKISYSGTGTSWNDLINKYNHTLSNANYTTVDGVPCFDVSSASKTIVDSGNTFIFGPSHTIISWARPLADSQVSTWRTLWRTSPNDHPLLIQDSTNLIGYYDNDTNTFISYGLNIGQLNIENKWTMFSLVADNGTTTLYINDGSVTGSVNKTTSGNSHDSIGNLASGGQPFGYISTAQIYNNRAMNLSDIKQNFQSLKGRFGL